jgi:hypothetical protein
MPKHIKIILSIKDFAHLAFAANFFADQSHCQDLFFASRKQIRLD